MSFQEAADSPRVLVTGGLGGIGLACAERFADAGARVFVTTRDDQRAADFSEGAEPREKGRIEAVVSDLDTPQAIRSLLERVGPIDVLVNNAGLNRPRQFLDLPIEDFDAVMNANVRNVFMLTRAVVAAMQAEQRGGSIVMMSSQAGTIGLPERVAYCASKHAVEGMVKSMAVDLAGSNIRINSVAPTFVETDMTRETLARDEFRRLIDSKLLIDRLPSVEDVANAVYFIGRPETGGITGATLPVDGGWTAH